MKVKFAIAGFGKAGRRHAALLSGVHNAELVAICDPQPCDYPAGPVHYDNAEALLQSGIAFDILCIATPNHLHEPIAIAALNAGKHILVEKPLALCADAAWGIAALAKQKNLIASCVLQNRFSPAAIALRSVMDEQLTGNLLFTQVNCFWSRNENYYANSRWHGRSAMDGGVLFTQFSHIIDYLIWLFGDLQPVDATIRHLVHYPGKEIPETGVVRFDAGKQGIVVLSFTTAVAGGNLDNSLTIIGDKGSVKLSGQYFEKLEHFNIKEDQAAAGNNAGSMQHNNPDNLRALYQSVIAQVDAGTPDYENITSACKAVEIIEKVHHMAAVQEWPVHMLVRAK